MVADCAFAYVVVVAVKTETIATSEALVLGYHALAAIQPVDLFLHDGHCKHFSELLFGQVPSLYEGVENVRLVRHSHVDSIGQLAGLLEHKCVLVGKRQTALAL